MDSIPDIRPGDLVKVYTKIKEGDKERIAPFQGIVIKIKGSDVSRTFTVRKVSAGIGIERIFPVQSPMIAKIEVKKKGKVRRAKLTYLRQRKGKKMKIKEATAPGAAAASAAEETAPPETEERPGEGTAGPEPVEKV
jgi:large subunit ribosomal protein L19